MKISFSIFYISDILETLLKQEGKAGKLNPAHTPPHPKQIRGILGDLSSETWSHNPIYVYCFTELYDRFRGLLLKQSRPLQVLEVLQRPLSDAQITTCTRRTYENVKCGFESSCSRWLRVWSSDRRTHLLWWILMFKVFRKSLLSVLNILFCPANSIPFNLSTQMEIWKKKIKHREKVAFTLVSHRADKINPLNVAPVPVLGQCCRLRG